MEAAPIAPTEETYDNRPIIAKPAYAIVGCNHLKDISALVNPEIEDGYEPIGAPFFEPSWQKWCQAIYRRQHIVALPTPALTPAERDMIKSHTERATERRRR